MTQPSVIVEIAFASPPNSLDSQLDWADVSTDVRTVSFTRGRTRSLDVYQAGTATVVLSNADRKYDPVNSASPHWDGDGTQVLPRKRIRIRADNSDDIWEILFEGYIENWTQRYNGPNDAVVEVLAADGFSVLTKTAVPGGPFDVDASQTSPVHWWPLNEPVGSADVFDKVTGAVGSVDDPINGFFGEQGLLSFSADTAYMQTGENENFIDLGSTGIIASSSEQHMRFDSATSQGVWTAKHADFSGLANMDIRVRCSTPDWTLPGGRNLIGHGGFNPALTYTSWYAWISNLGYLRIWFTRADGTGFYAGGFDPLDLTYGADEIAWLGITVSHTTGNSFDVRFWHCADADYDGDIHNWTEDSGGTQVVDLGAPTIHNPSSANLALCIGNQGYVTTSNLLGNVYGVQDIYEAYIRSTVNGTVVAFCDFTDVSQWSLGDSGGSTGTHGGKVWTVVNNTGTKPYILGATQPLSMSAVIQCDPDVDYTFARVIAFQGHLDGTPNYAALTVSTTGTATFQVVAGASTGGVSSTVLVNDGEIYHLCGTYSETGELKIFVEGVDDTTTPDTQALTLDDAAMRIGNAKPEQLAYTFPGSLAHVMTWDRALTDAEVLALRTATVTPWQGDTTGERIEKVLDLVGWPTDRRDVDTGDSTLQATGFGTDALSLMQTISRSELVGQMFVAKDGSLKFIQRSNQYGLTPVAAFSDVYGADSPVQAIEPSYAQNLRNSATVSRDQGKVQQAQNPSSIAKFQLHSYDELTGLQHDSDALSLAVAQKIVEQYGTPALRVSSLTILPRHDPDTLFPIVCALEIGDWVETSWTPQGVGDPITLTSIVEMISMSISAGETAWTVTLNLSPAPVGLSAVGVIAGDGALPVGFPINLNTLDSRIQRVEGDVEDLDAAVGPIGSITMWPSASIPSNWLVCDGSSFSGATYPTLAVVLGGTTLPDMRDRNAVGVSGTKAVKTTGGSTALPAHVHTEGAHTHSNYSSMNLGTAVGSSTTRLAQGGGANSVSGGLGGNTGGLTAGANTGSAGTVGVTTTQNPYTALYYIIRAA